MPEISPIYGKNSVHTRIRLHSDCVFIGRKVHTHGKRKKWGELLKELPPFRVKKECSYTEVG